YVRDGRYSAGAFVGRFGSWGNISTAKDAEGAKKKPVSRELTRKTRMPEKSNHKGHQGTQRECNGDSVLHNFDRVPLAQVPTPLVGMRRVTEAVAQMVVNTLLGSNQPSALSIQTIQNQNR